MMMLTLGPETERNLDALAAKAGRTRDDYIRELILDHLEDIEDLEAVRDYEERKRNGTLKTYSSEEVRRELGLDD